MACASTSSYDLLAFAEFHMDRQNECLWADGRIVRMQCKTFRVLRYLAERPWQLVKKDELIRDIWEGLRVGDSVLKTHLNHIRMVLGDDARNPRFIQTVHGRGYRFIAEVRFEPVHRAAPIPTTWVGCEGAYGRLEGDNRKGRRSQ